jgi:hypothetical protein
MYTRHRVPTIFNLSMVDVLCCALGCVILLWLINLREAKERTLQAGQTGERLQQTEAQLDETASLLLHAVGERDALAHQAEEAARERDQTRRSLAGAREEMARLDRTLADLKSENAAAGERLAALARAGRSLAKEKDVAADQVRDLEAQLRDKETLAERLRDAELRARRLREEGEAAREKLTEAEARARELEKDAGARRQEMTDAGRQLEALRREKEALADRVQRAQAAVENRFEGITLTGRRVVFLVDMSGSMELVDEQTAAPHKWEGVRQTLTKVMRSLPELEKFQVILFSDKSFSLLGTEGRWIDFDAKTSADRVERALSAVKPLGGTNLYEALEAAFRYRPLGLDTIYLFSDGLPNAGPGLPGRGANQLSETDRSAILARYLRNLLRKDWNREIAGQARVRINTVGFFYESPDVGAFLWALARENDGSFVGMSKP